jgi:hypothetical protein
MRHEEPLCSRDLNFIAQAQTGSIYHEQQHQNPVIVAFEVDMKRTDEC